MKPFIEGVDRRQDTLFSEHLDAGIDEDNPVRVKELAANSRLRRKCLNASWLLSMADARARIEERRCDFNESWHRSAVGGWTRAEFAEQLKPARKVA